MKILLITPYKEQLHNNTTPPKILLKHFNNYHKLIFDKLCGFGHQVIVVDGFEDNLIELVKEVDLIFNIRSDFGFDLLDIYPYILPILKNKKIVGSSIFQKIYDSDKIIAKLLADRIGIPTPHYFFSYETDYLDDNKLYVLKPRFTTSSKNLSDKNVMSGAEIKKRLISLKNKEKYYIEEYIEGKTLNVGLFKNNFGDILIPTPTTLKSLGTKIIDYKTKKMGGNIEKEIVNDKTIIQKASSYLLKLYHFLEPTEIFRCDFILDDKCNIYFLEINTTPNLNINNSFIMMLINDYFKDYDSFLTELIDSAPILDYLQNHDNT